MNNNELQHHGVLGMKWGVRRYQNKDGTLTEAGKKRYDNYDSRNPIQWRKSKLTQQYVEKGYSKSAAETLAEQRMRTELALAVIGGVTVSVIAKKAITRIGQDYCDKVIKAGKDIQNIGANGKVDFNDTPFYAAINRHDKKAYGMLYPHEKRVMAKEALGSSYEGIYKNKIKVSKDIKQASVNNARKIFYEKMNSDPQFKKEVVDTIKSTQYGANADYLLKTNPKLFYNRFNQALATPQFQSKGLPKQFYSVLEKNGYNAILDINDARYSGYKKISKSPTIFFGKDMVEKIGNVKLSDLEIDHNSDKYIRYLYAKNWAKIGARNTASFMVLKNTSDEKKIREYLNEHPNSKLSRKEILDVVKHKKNGK